jgi:hypothetical protein
MQIRRSVIAQFDVAMPGGSGPPPLAGGSVEPDPGRGLDGHVAAGEPEEADARLPAWCPDDERHARPDGVVRVTDVPREAGGRAYLVERQLEEEGPNASAALQALIATICAKLASSTLSRWLRISSRHPAGRSSASALKAVPPAVGSGSGGRFV